MADSGAKPPKNPGFTDNAALARIVTLKKQYPGMREIDYEDLAERIEKSEARKEREAEEAEQKRIARLEQEDADLAKLQAETKNASFSKKVLDIGYELVVPQDKMDWALLILGGLGKIGKGGKIIKILDKEKALAEIAKKRKAVQEELRASQKAKQGTTVEKKNCKLLQNGVPGVGYRGGRHGNIKKGGTAYSPERQSHHMPADTSYESTNGVPVASDSKPSIQMDKSDHQQTASWGNSNSAQAYRNTQRSLIAKGKPGYLAAMTMDIADIRAKFGNKYDGAIAQMMVWAKCMGYI